MVVLALKKWLNVSKKQFVSMSSLAHIFSIGTYFQRFCQWSKQTKWKNGDGHLYVFTCSPNQKWHERYAAWIYDFSLYFLLKRNALYMQTHNAILIGNYYRFILVCTMCMVHAVLTSKICSRNLRSRFIRNSAFSYILLL